MSHSRTGEELTERGYYQGEDLTEYALRYSSSVNVNISEVLLRTDWGIAEIFLN